MKRAICARRGLALAAVLIAAAVLRFWALGRGIPYARAGRRTGDRRARRQHDALRFAASALLRLPGLYIYVQLAVVVRPVPRPARSPASGRRSTGGPGGSFYLWGRRSRPLFGVATVLLVYQIGMRWGARHALLAAGLMAVLPLHVRYSHYVLTDTPLTFFVTLTLLLSLRAHERGTARGVRVGGRRRRARRRRRNTTARIALIMPLLACWMTPGVRPGGSGARSRRSRPAAWRF